MEVIVKEGKEIKQYKATGDIGSGEGARAVSRFFHPPFDIKISGKSQ